MYFLGLGLILLAMKYLEYGWVANWSWYVVLTPFALAAAWWSWADFSGYTKRRAIDRMEQRRRERVDKHKEALRGGPAKRR
ncbi:MAG: TIGR04438 family Trp-rich protein [Curvibacter sp.]|nr:TIGR04438 family Trp-rich protein [Curvibacter sp.]